MEIDEVYGMIGDFGIYHAFLFFCIFPSFLCLPFHWIHNIFIAAKTDFYCENNTDVYNHCPIEEECQFYSYNSEITSVVSEVWESYLL